jgi:hypothetical protein
MRGFVNHVRPRSFFTDEMIAEAFQGAYVARSLREDLLADLARKDFSGMPDAEEAAARARLLRGELERYGMDERCLGRPVVDDCSPASAACAVVVVGFGLRGPRRGRRGCQPFLRSGACMKPCGKPRLVRGS